jgi:hypothetical protein
MDINECELSNEELKFKLRLVVCKEDRLNDGHPYLRAGFTDNIRGFTRLPTTPRPYLKTAITCYQ